jgi:hypothetical protein
VPNIAGARRYIEVPAPAPKVGGLFAVARVIDTTDPHDLLGAEYQTDSCLPAQHWSAGNCGYGYPESLCNPDPDPVATLKTLRGIGTLVTGDPFTVYDGIECEGWSGKRLCVGRRARREGELLWQHFALVTNLRRDDARMKRLMGGHRLCFEEAVWRLYDGKQGCENLWKEQLCDLGLHHPPSARVSANAAFYAIAMVAANLATGFRRLVLPPASRPLRLWRLRREIIDMAATAARHGRCVLLRLRDARTNLVEQLRHAMLRVARL